MGLRDVFSSILGKSKLPEAKVDRIFAISTAVVAMELDLGLVPHGKAGICFKSMEMSRYQAVKEEIEGLLGHSAAETGTRYKLEKDEYNYLWVVLEDPDFEDLVTNVHMISQTLIESGFGELLLCAAYRFNRDGPVYWIYNFKQGSYYPFVPKGKNTRDNSTEIRFKALIEKELPIEKEMEKWYPLWGMPL